MSENKILITGGEGYLGSVLIPLLISKGLECESFDTNYFSDCLLYSGDKHNLITEDVRKISPEEIDGVNTVVHLAGISNDPFGGLVSRDVYDFSLGYTKRLAEICKEKKVKFIFASSCSVYGKTSTKYELNEMSDTNPQTGYSLNKLQIEEILLNLSDDDFHPLILRFATLFGLSPKMRFDIVINMLTGMAVTQKDIFLNSDGLAWRPFIHIVDACTAIYEGIKFLQSSDDTQVINVGSNEHNYRIIQIAEEIKNLVEGSEINFFNSSGASVFADKKIQDGVDSRTYKVNFEKVSNLFDSFYCKYNLVDGIREMVRKFEEIKLDKKELENKNYYRLQKMDYLFSEGLIDKELFWK